MEEYASNSHNLKKQEAQIAEKKIAPVVTSSVKTKKKSGLRKIKDVLIAEDSSNVASYIFLDVLVPAIKKAISDIITNGIDMLLYGDSGRTKKGTASKISYRSYYDKRYEDRVESRNRERSESLDYDNIIFENRGDAEAVLNSMMDIISQFGVVSIGDLYDLADISTSNYTANKYGWTDIQTAQVIRGRDGYYLKLPRALPID